MDTLRIAARIAAGLTQPLSERYDYGTNPNNPGLDELVATTDEFLAQPTPDRLSSVLAAIRLADQALKDNEIPVTVKKISQEPVASNELKDEADVAKVGQAIGDMMAEILGTKTKFDGKSVRDAQGQPDEAGVAAIKSNMGRVVDKLTSMGLRKTKEDYATVKMTNDAGVFITINKVPPNDTLAVVRPPEK